MVAGYWAIARMTAVANFINVQRNGAVRAYPDRDACARVVQGNHHAFSIVPLAHSDSFATLESLTCATPSFIH